MASNAPLRMAVVALTLALSGCGSSPDEELAARACNEFDPSAAAGSPLALYEWLDAPISDIRAAGDSERDHAEIFIDIEALVAERCPERFPGYVSEQCDSFDDSGALAEDPTVITEQDIITVLCETY